MASRTADAAPAAFSAQVAALEARDLNAYFGATHAVRHVTLDFPANVVSAIIGRRGIQ